MLPPRKKKRKKENKLLAGISRSLFLAALFFFCLTTGCKENESTPDKPEVVRQKIVQQNRTDKSHADSKDAPLPPLSKPPLPQASPQPIPEPVAAESKDEITDLDTKQEPQLRKHLYSYNPEGKLDPFMPIFAARQNSESLSTRKQAKMTLPLTPLQKIDISQLRLVAVIRSSAGNKAMVEDASGKGYIITSGAYIGTNFGKVMGISTDKVVVQEEVEDIISGEITIREVALKLPQKYEGGSIQ